MEETFSIMDLFHNNNKRETNNTVKFREENNISSNFKFTWYQIIK